MAALSVEETIALLKNGSHNNFLAKRLNVAGVMAQPLPNSGTTKLGALLGFYGKIRKQIGERSVMDINVEITKVTNQSRRVWDVSSMAWDATTYTIVGIRIETLAAWAPLVGAPERAQDVLRTRYGIEPTLPFTGFWARLRDRNFDIVGDRFNKNVVAHLNPALFSLPVDNSKYKEIAKQLVQQMLASKPSPPKAFDLFERYYAR
jgi:hypothetical protein